MEAVQNHQFVEPRKIINSIDDLERFKNSQCYSLIVGFLVKLQEAVRSKPRSATVCTPKAESIVQLLQKHIDWIDQVPPIEQPQRYGNRAFTTFQRRVVQEGPQAIRQALESFTEYSALLERGLAEELSTYLSQAFGDPTRIDYGTGHELNFLCFLLILCGVGYFTERDYASIVHHVWWAYMRVMRKLQDTYKQEPAGSHGVWGLDDYHFIPFILGAAELCGHPEYTPASIHNDTVLNRYHEEYLYFDCIKVIKETKSAGHFGEHSPMLNDISAVPNWEKVAQGLIKMYQAEVMNKLPVMRHFFFGSVLTFS